MKQEFEIKLVYFIQINKSSVYKSLYITIHDLDKLQLSTSVKRPLRWDVSQSQMMVTVCINLNSKVLLEIMVIYRLFDSFVHSYKMNLALWFIRSQLQRCLYTYVFGGRGIINDEMETPKVKSRSQQWELMFVHLIVNGHFIWRIE